MHFFPPLGIAEEYLQIYVSTASQIVQNKIIVVIKG